MSSLRPLGERVVLEIIEEDDETSFGLILPPDAKDLPQRGKVLAVGPGTLLKGGTYAPLNVQKHDIVLYTKYAGHKVKVEGSEYLIVDIDHILGVLDGSAES